ncbi:MAG: hypothetical protein RLY86_546 [Pseudomonadota bacterium]|jgi:DNA-binding MarR family transcriptional regulator
MTAATTKRRKNTPLEVIELFRDWYPDASLKSACAFLYVAENEGISMSELAFLLKTSLSTATRIAAALSGGRNGLLEVRPWPGDGRVRTVHLSPRGRTLMDLVNAEVVDARPIAPPGLDALMIPPVAAASLRAWY